MSELGYPWANFQDNTPVIVNCIGNTTFTGKVKSSVKAKVECPRRLNKLLHNNIIAGKHLEGMNLKEA